MFLFSELRSERSAALEVTLRFTRLAVSIVPRRSRGPAQVSPGSHFVDVDAMAFADVEAMTVS